MGFRYIWLIGILVVSLTLSSSTLFAQMDEWGGRQGEAAEGEEFAAVEPPKLRPITITFAGTLDSVNSTASPPMIVVQDRYGVRKEMSVPSDAEIAQGNETLQVTDLVVGEKLTVEYTYDVATGKRSAQSIQMGEETI